MVLLVHIIIANCIMTHNSTVLKCVKKISFVQSVFKILLIPDNLSALLQAAFQFLGRLYTVPTTHYKFSCVRKCMVGW